VIRLIVGALAFFAGSDLIAVAEPPPDPQRGSVEWGGTSSYPSMALHLGALLYSRPGRTTGSKAELHGIGSGAAECSMGVSAIESSE
jgi:hypothetical protein